MLRRFRVEAFPCHRIRAKGGLGLVSAEKTDLTKIMLQMTILKPVMCRIMQKAEGEVLKDSMDEEVMEENAAVMEVEVLKGTGEVMQGSGRVKTKPISSYLHVMQDLTFLVNYNSSGHLSNRS